MSYGDIGYMDTTLVCKRCGNCDKSKLKLERHIFKNNTTHVKQHCFECGYSNWVTKAETIQYANHQWITDHSRSARKKREAEFIKIRRDISKDKHIDSRLDDQSSNTSIFDYL